MDYRWIEDKNDFGRRAFSSAAPQIWNYQYILLSESHHHLTPSNVTSKLIILPRHNTLSPCNSPAPLIDFFQLWSVIKYFSSHGHFPCACCTRKISSRNVPLLYAELRTHRAKGRPAGQKMGAWYSTPHSATKLPVEHNSYIHDKYTQLKDHYGAISDVSN